MRAGQSGAEVLRARVFPAAEPAFPADGDAVVGAPPRAPKDRELALTKPPRGQP